MKMTREEAKEYVLGQQPIFLQTAKVRGQYICPNCGHGKGGDGLAENPRSKGHKHWKCFGCDRSMDIIELWEVFQEQQGCIYSDTKELFGSLYEFFGIEIIDDGSGIKDGYNSHAGNVNGKVTPKTLEQRTNEPLKTDIFIDDYDEKEFAIDFTDRVMQAHEELLTNKDALKYLHSRGISDSIIEDYKLGYSAEGHNSLLKENEEYKSKSAKVCLYNYVFPYPTNDGRFDYYLTEISDRAKIDSFNKKYKKINSGGKDLPKLNARLFNERYLKEAHDVVFICEGIYDALSVEEVGGKAIAFVGTAHKRFLSIVKKYKPRTTFILSLDSDSAGNGATERVKEGLDSLNVPYIVRSSTNGKDFNDFLVNDKDDFERFVRTAEHDAKNGLTEKERVELETYRSTSAKNYIQNFVKHIKDSAERPIISTGFEGFDKKLGGGLYEGLYVVGAVSSLGKTTFVTQVADQIAQQGTDVMFFSLEMSKDEIIAKSVSRLTMIECINRKNDLTEALQLSKSTRQILTGSMYKNFNEEEKGIITRALKKYSEYSDKLYIREEIGSFGVEELTKAVREHIRITKRTPVVCIDYLQILAPSEPRASDKQNTDKAVLELKRLARECHVPVLAISSLNRESYSSAISMSAYKESGAIEYSSDVLIGMQFSGAGTKDFDLEKQKRRVPRAVEVRILKNRNGMTGTVMPFDYYPAQNYYKEAVEFYVGKYYDGYSKDEAEKTFCELDREQENEVSLVDIKKKKKKVGSL